MKLIAFMFACLLARAGVVQGTVGVTLAAIPVRGPAVNESGSLGV